jgi:hypothetical protein
MILFFDAKIMRSVKLIEVSKLVLILWKLKKYYFLTSYKKCETI